jgi:hypothetical protein
MAILDFLFGRTKPTPTTTTVQQTSKLPEEIAPFVKEVLGEAQDLFQQRKAEGYKEFPGETIAPRTPEELAALEGLRGLVGTQEPYRAEAEEAIRATPTQFTAEEAQRLMSPYQRAVTDIEKREAQRAFERDVRPALEAQAVGAGGMSGLGTRAAVQAAEAQRGQSQLLADIEAKGQQRAFEQAYRQFGDEIGLQRQRAFDIGDFGTQRFNIGLAERGLQQQLGQEDRAEAQALLNEQFAEFLEREQFPESTLAQYSSFIYGNPFLRTPDTARTTSGVLQPSTSLGQQLVGLGLTGLNIAGRGGAFGGGKVDPTGFALGNIFARKGGGLASLPIVKKSQGQIVGPYSVQKMLRAIRPRVGSTLGKAPPKRKTGTPYREALENRNRALAALTAGQLGRAQTRLIQQNLARESAIQKAIENQEKQLEGLDPYSGPTKAAIDALYGEGVETKGLIGAINTALPAFFDASSKQEKERKKIQAEIDAKKAALEMTALEKQLTGETEIATKEDTAEREQLIAEQAVDDKVDKRSQEEYAIQVKDLKEKAGIISSLSTAQANRAKNKDNAVSAFNAIVKRVEDGFAVTYARSNPNDPNSPMIMYVGGKAVTPESRKEMNKAKQAAYNEYLSKGEGTAGFKAALEKITELTGGGSAVVLD